MWNIANEDGLPGSIWSANSTHRQHGGIYALPPSTSRGDQGLEKKEDPGLMSEAGGAITKQILDIYRWEGWAVDRICCAILPWRQYWHYRFYNPQGIPPAGDRNGTSAGYLQLCAKTRCARRFPRRQHTGSQILSTLLFWESWTLFNLLLFHRNGENF